MAETATNLPIFETFLQTTESDEVVRSQLAEVLGTMVGKCITISGYPEMVITPSGLTAELGGFVQCDVRGYVSGPAEDPLCISLEGHQLIEADEEKLEVAFWPPAEQLSRAEAATRPWRPFSFIYPLAKGRITQLQRSDPDS